MTDTNERFMEIIKHEFPQESMVYQDNRRRREKLVTYLAGGTILVAGCISVAGWVWRLQKLVLLFLVV